MFQSHNAPNLISFGTPFQTPLGEFTALPRPHGWILGVLLLKYKEKEGMRRQKIRHKKVGEEKRDKSGKRRGPKKKREGMGRETRPQFTFLATPMCSTTLLRTQPVDVHNVHTVSPAERSGLHGACLHCPSVVNKNDPRWWLTARDDPLERTQAYKPLPSFRIIGAIPI